MKLPFNVSESVKKRNPELFGLAPVSHSERQSVQRSQSQDRQLAQSQGSVACCVTIISFRRKLIDGHDNLRTGAKPLVDRITESLGFRSDDDPQLTWQYAQVRTDGEQGTLVKIETL